MSLCTVSSSQLLLGARLVGESMPGFSNERLDSGGSHLLHRLHCRHLRLPADPAHLPRSYSLPHSQKRRLCHRSASYIREGQVHGATCCKRARQILFAFVFFFCQNASLGNTNSLCKPSMRMTLEKFHLKGTKLCFCEEWFLHQKKRYIFIPNFCKEEVAAF